MLLSITRTSYVFVKKEISIGMLLGYGYMRNNLVHLGGYLTHQDVADMSNLFYFYSVLIWSRVMTCLPKSRLLKQNGMKKNRYKHFRQPVETKLLQMGMYQFKLTKNLFLSRDYEHVSGEMEQTLYRHKNITEAEGLSGYFFHINTKLLCHHKNFLYKNCIFSVLS